METYNKFFWLVLALLGGALLLAINSCLDAQNEAMYSHYLAANSSLALEGKQADYDNLLGSMAALRLQNDELKEKYGALGAIYNESEAGYSETHAALQRCLANASQAGTALSQCEGNVLFRGGNVTVYYYLLDGTKHASVYDVQTLNYYLMEGVYNRRIAELYGQGFSILSISQYFGQARMNRFLYKGETSPILYFQGANGSGISMVNYMAFEDMQSVSELANSIEAGSKNDSEFLRNVLYVKSQVNGYTYNLQGEPRYPLETFLEGGGDCGVSSLFVGSVIKAAHPDWKVRIMFIDSESSFASPSAINHAMLYVNNNAGISTYIETTAQDADTALSYYQNKTVYGWSFDF